MGLNATYNKNTVTGLSLVPDTSQLEFKLEEFQGELEICTNTYSWLSYFYLFLYEATYDESGNPIENQFIDPNNDSVK